MPVFRRLSSIFALGCVLIAPAVDFGVARAGERRMNEAPVAAPLETDTKPPARESAAAAPPPSAGFTVDPASREASRIFFRTVHAASEDIPSGWNGNVAAGNAGTTSAAFQQAVQRRVNYFRAMAGVPAAITFDPTYNTRCQQAALMMSANNDLSHSPDPGWVHYSAGGADGAANSNLFLGFAGPSAITGYVEDFGSVNAAVGHRRWLLFPQTRTMGTGDIPGDATYNSSNALWVLTPERNDARPVVRNDFVAWPPPGFVPYSLVFPRWSFAYPGADFSSATVAMKRAGANVAVVVQSRGAGAGENAIVWVWDGRNANVEAGPGTAPAADTPVQVEVKGVRINGSARDFAYTVTLFDPQKSGADTVLPTVSGPASGSIGVAQQFTVGAVPQATGYQFRRGAVLPLTAVEGAENGTGGVTVNAAPGYAIISSAYQATGAKSFHLTTPDFGGQSVTLNRTVLPTASARLKLKSRFGYATAQQVARVQVSTDDGVSWDSLLVLRGTNAPTVFTERTVSLAAYAERTLRVRCAFAYEGSGAAYPQTDENIGWYFDDLAFENADELRDVTTGSMGTGTGFGFTPAAGGDFLVQARAQFFGEFPFEWGPAKRFSTAAPPQILAHPASATVNAGSTVQLSVQAVGRGTLTYRWWRGSEVLAATGAVLTLADIQPAAAGVYRVEVTDAFGTTPSDPATIEVLVPPPVVQTGAGETLGATSVRLTGRVEAPGQTVGTGFEYGTTSALGSELSAGSLTSPGDLASTLSGLPAGAIVFFRAFALTTGGTRFRGEIRAIGTADATATLAVQVAGDGTVSGVPAGPVRVGDEIRLRAVPGAGQYFVGWSGGATSAAAALNFTMPVAMSLTATFAPSPVRQGAGRYLGLVGNVPRTHAGSGLLNLTVTATGAFSGTLQFAGARFGVRGVFDVAGVARFATGTQATFSRTGAPPLTLALRLAPGSTMPLRLLGELRAGTEPVIAVNVPRLLFTATRTPVAPLRQPPAEWLGTFTSELEVSSATPVPNLKGRGWATVAVARDGTAAFRGAAPDGLRWSFSLPVAGEGRVPFYVPLYAGQGAIVGEVTFAGTPVVLSAGLHWFRPAAFSGERFPTGWPAGVTVDFTGHPYVPFRAGVSWPLPGLAATAGSGRLWANGGGVTAEYEWPVRASLATGRAAVLPMSSGATVLISFAPGTGVFTGSYKASPSAAAVGWSGVLNQRDNRARGFFLTPAGSGAVTLLPRP